MKTHTWCTTGTAGEKILGVPFKYSELPRLYGKPLKIICVAYQERELYKFGVIGETSVENRICTIH